MTEQQLQNIAVWFDRFVATFQANTAAEQRNYDLKTEHTFRVRAIMEKLAASLDLTPEERTLAAAIALCHDVGRFPQYRLYGTFNDATSVNHSALAVQTLKADGILDDIDADERSTLLQAVALHNAFTLPESLDPAVCCFARLIRDADKLDIWRVLIEYCTAESGERASAVMWELPETGACTSRALDEVRAGRMLHRNRLETADDFKLLQLSWVFDLNFDESCAILDELGYIETLAALLPCQPGCPEAVAVVRNAMKKRAGQSH